MGRAIMKKPILSLCTSLALCASFSINASDNNVTGSDTMKKQNCPDHLVNFWQRFSTTNDKQTMPSFLVVNQCVDSREREKQTNFYLTTQLRFEEPANDALVNQLYSNLDWQPVE
jgi:hypothetical protein